MRMVRPRGYLRRLLPSLSVSMDAGSVKTYSSKPFSTSSQAMRVGFSVLGFSMSGGAPAINWRARRAARTTYANWLSGALVSTVIFSLFLRRMPEDARLGAYAGRCCSARRLQSTALHDPRCRHFRSLRKNRNTCRRRQSHRGPWPDAERFLHPRPERVHEACVPVLRAKAAK